MGILVALQLTQEQRPVIVSDCESALTSVVNTLKRPSWRCKTLGGGILLSIAATVALKKMSPHFRWTKGHNGNPGNDAADILSKAARRLPYIGMWPFPAPAWCLWKGNIPTLAPCVGKPHSPSGNVDNDDDDRTIASTAWFSTNAFLGAAWKWFHGYTTLPGMGPYFAREDVLCPLCITSHPAAPMRIFVQCPRLARLREEWTSTTPEIMRLEVTEWLSSPSRTLRDRLEFYRGHLPTSLWAVLTQSWSADEIATAMRRVGPRRKRAISVIQSELTTTFVHSKRP